MRASPSWTNYLPEALAPNTITLWVKHMNLGGWEYKQSTKKPQIFSVSPGAMVLKVLPWTSFIGTTWELVRNANSWAPPQTYLLNQILMAGPSNGF